ncbi:hypothetical protein AB1Y20_000619 [Prymnesium parvum]|uniref:Uncharacterized protein n=1 Tax=Prymnesium parvum TaxID=97485 RepID=A0AB34K5W8_PRYPA
MQHLSPYLQQGSDPTREQIGDALRLIRLKCHSRVEAPLLSSSSHVHSPMSASTAPMLSWSSRSPRRASDHTHTPDVAAECLHTSECRCRVCRSDYDALLIKPPQPPEAAYPAMPEHPSPGQEKDRQVGSLEPRLRTALPQASGTQHTGRPTARQVAGLLSEARQPLPPAGVAERAELRCCLSGLFDSAASASSPLTPAPNALPSPSMTLRTTNPLPHASAQTALLEPDEDEDESLASIRSRLARASEKYQKLNEEWLHDLCGVPAPQARSPPVTDSLQPHSRVCTPHSTVRTPHSWAGSGAPGAPAPLLADGTPPAVAPSKESPPAEPPSWADAAAARTSARASALQPAYSQWLAAQTTASLQPQPHRLGDTPSPYQVPTAPLTWEARHETVGKERVISPPKNAASVSPHELRGLRREDDAHDEQLQRVEEELACTEASTCGADEPENGSNRCAGRAAFRPSLHDGLLSCTWREFAGPHAARLVRPAAPDATDSRLHRADSDVDLPPLRRRGRLPPGGQVGHPLLSRRHAFVPRLA